MRSRRWHRWVWLSAVAASVLAGPAFGQEEREREELRQRVAEAQRRVERAQRQLEAALRALAQAETRQALRSEAVRELERAMDELRAAQREIERNIGRDFEVIRAPGAVAVITGDRPRIGVVVQTTPDAATDSIGARITAVTPGWPAAEAGLKAGDIVTQINGESLARRGSERENPGDKLIRLVQTLPEGDSVRITYRRDGETHTVALKPRTDSWYSFRAGRLDLVMPQFDSGFRGERFGFEPMELGDRVVALSRLSPAWFGMELVTLDAELGEYFGTSEGLLVVRAPRRDDIPLRGGDVILRIDGRVPTSPAHALRIFRSYEPGETANVEVMRNKRRQTIAIRIPERE